MNLPFQPSFADLGRPLAATVFCVVDLETTGVGDPAEITEIGAVRVCGGEVTGEFATLVRPSTPIPAHITTLTGITNSMVADAPPISTVLPSFLEFARGCVLVAHNASFDIGFLKRACAEHDYAWPAPEVLDTVALSRSVLKGEVRNHKLGTLAQYFKVRTQPNHRALDDARATVEVFHGLIERVGNLRVDTLEDLAEFQSGVSPARRAKRTLAADVPTGPGVYTFYADLPERDGVLRRQVLYVGKSTNLRSRVRSYFTASERRPRIEEMIAITTGVDATPCRTPLEAEVLELRLIAAHRPRYNRVSKFPERQVWLRLTREPFPRLSVVRAVTGDAFHFGPIAGRRAAEDVLLALYSAFPLRQCSQRLSPSKPSPTCPLGELGKCVSPCDLSVTVDAYADVAAHVQHALSHDIRPVLDAHAPRLAALVAAERYEEAGTLRDRVQTFVRASVRHQRVRTLAACPELVAAYLEDDGWHIHVIRYGRLAATALARPGDVPQPVARDAVAVAESVAKPSVPEPAALIEETERIAAWLERPGVRFISMDGDWAWARFSGVNAATLAQHLLG